MWFLTAIRRLRPLGAATIGLMVMAWAPIHALSQVKTECFCGANFGWRVNQVPRNYRILVDVHRFDIGSLQLALAPTIGSGAGNMNIDVTSEPFFETQMHMARPTEAPLVGRQYGIAAFPADDFPRDIVAIGTSFTIEDVVDTEPPVAGNLRVPGEVFTNDCGAQALVLEDAGTTDNFSRGTRLPILVTLRGESAEFQTVTGTFGATDAVNAAVIAKSPYLGSCITDEGLETLDFERGESVEVTMVVYDYAGNASKPVVQTIAWPIGEVDSSSSGNGGCRVEKTNTRSGALALVIFVLVSLARRRRPA